MNRLLLVKGQAGRRSTVVFIVGVVHGAGGIFVPDTPPSKIDSVYGTSSVFHDAALVLFFIVRGGASMSAFVAQACVSVSHGCLEFLPLSGLCKCYTGKG